MCLKSTQISPLTTQVFRGLCQHRNELIKICIFFGCQVWSFNINPRCLQENLRLSSIQISFVRVIHIKILTTSSWNGGVALDKVFPVYMTLVCRRCWFNVVYTTRKKFSRNKSFQVHCDNSMDLVFARVE